VRDQSGRRPDGDHRDEPAGVALSALASKATGFPIAKRIVHSGAEVAQFMAQAGKLRELGPILIDRYLQDAIEVDRIKDGPIAMVINTTDGQQTIRDSYELRRAALLHGVPYYTTVAGARATIGAIRTMATGKLPLTSLQSYFAPIGLINRRIDSADSLRIDRHAT
jgi:hypothetical protein